MATGGGTLLSPKRVVDDWEQVVLRKYLRLEKVVPPLMERKVFPRKLGKLILKKPESGMDMFLGWLKESPVDTFVAFLEVLEGTFPQCEDHRALVKTMSPSLEIMALPPDPRCRRSVERIISSAQSAGLPVCTAASDHERLHPPDGYTQPYLEKEFSRDGEIAGVVHCPAHGITITIPPEAIPPNICKYEFRMYVYLQLQGPFKFPDNSEVCTPIVWLNTHPTFPFARDVSIKLPHCTVISEHFHEEICVLRAPDNQTSVYEFTDTVDIDHCDDFYIVANTRHFSLVGGVRQKSRTSRRKRGSRKRGSLATRKRQLKIAVQQCTPELVRQTSSASSATSQDSSASLSLESSFEHQSGTSAPALRLPSAGSTENSTTLQRPELTRQDAVEHVPPQESSSSESGMTDITYNQLCILKAEPQKLTTMKWTTAFLLSRFLPTALLALRPAARMILREKEVRCDLQLFVPLSNYLEFQPEQWSTNGWRVIVEKTPMISVQQITQCECLPESQSGLDARLGICLPHIAYLIDGTKASADLECRIDVKGADVNGRPLYYMLMHEYATSTPHFVMDAGNSSRLLQTPAGLYSRDSQLCVALQSGLLDCTIDLEEADHRRVIADISFQLTGDDYEKLPQLLTLTRSQVDRITFACRNDMTEEIYNMIHTWVVKQHPNTTLRLLISILQRLGIAGIEVVSTRNEQFEHSTPIPSEVPLQSVAEQMGYQWKFVARFLGVRKVTLDEVAQGQETLQEKKYQMLLKWKMQYGNEATYGMLLKAIHRVFEHDPSSVCSALWHLVKQMQNADLTSPPLL